MKIWQWVVLAILVLLAAAFFMLPTILFHSMLGRPSRTPKVPQSYMESPHYKASISGRELMKNIPSEDHYIESRDGLKLHAYLFPAEQESKKFVLGIHGYKSYSRPEFAPYIEFYRSLGYNMLLPDDRAHAPSEGEYIGFGVLDRLDCVDWAKYIVDTYGEDVEILMHGVSMGAATVVSASGDADLPEQVMGVVSDCGFTRAYDVMEFMLKDMMKMPGVDYLLPRVEKVCEKKAGYNFHDNAAVDLVKNSRVPMVFVHGAKDQMVPAYMVQELYDACPTEKRLLVVDEAAHGESIAFAPEEYHTAIRELFGI